MWGGGGGSTTGGGRVNVVGSGFGLPGDPARLGELDWQGELVRLTIGDRCSGGGGGNIMVG